MTFANPLPSWALCLVVAAAAGVAWHAYRHLPAAGRARYALSALRFLTLMLIVVVLMRPVARGTAADARDAVVAVLVDVSRSMAIEDGTRINADRKGRDETQINADPKGRDGTRINSDPKGQDETRINADPKGQDETRISADPKGRDGTRINADPKGQDETRINADSKGRDGTRINAGSTSLDRGASRIELARQLLIRSVLPALQDKLQVEVLGFGEATAPIEPDALSATARQSDLSAALAAVRERYRGRPLAGVILLSDGGDTGADAARSAAGGAAVYPIGIGSPALRRDREIVSVTTADAVLDDSRVELAVSAVSHGRGTEPFDLRLLENGRVIEVRRTAPVADGAPVRELFQVAPGRGGPTVYTVEIPAASDELVPENNTRSTLVQPPTRPRRILLVEGAPGFEHSFLKRAWAIDSGLEIDSVVRKGRNDQGRNTFYIQAVQSRSGALRDGYPVKPDDLFRYDAVVLANLAGHQLTRAQLEATRAFVAERGGGLLVLGAHSFLQQGMTDTPIENVLPLDLNDRGGGVLPASNTSGSNRVMLTEQGESHPVMQLAPSADDSRRRWEAVPALASIAALGGPRPGASVLAVASGPGGAPRALVAVQRFGEGRAMVFTGEAAWRWRMLLPAADRSYDTFWRQAVRWLSIAAPEPVALSVPAGGSPGAKLPLRITVRNAAFVPLPDAAIDVRIATPDGKLEQLRAEIDPEAAAPGRYVAHFTANQPGVYRVTAEARAAGAAVGSASTSMLVGGADAEMADPRLNEPVLQRVAAASGGRMVTPDQIEPLAQTLQAGIPAAVRSVRRDLWHNGWWLLALVTLLTSEWVVRRRWGLR